MFSKIEMTSISLSRLGGRGQPAGRQRGKRERKIYFP